MLKRIQDILRSRKEEGDKGFSLVELAVVIVIIGILVAVAVPIFLGMQASANEAADESAAANGAAMVAAEIAKADGGTAALTALQAVVDQAQGTEAAEVSIADGADASAVTLDDYCVTRNDAAKGPGCE